MHLGCFYFPWEPLEHLFLATLATQAYAFILQVTSPLNFFFWLTLLDTISFFFFLSLPCRIELLNILVNSEEVSISQVYYSIVSIC